jgi:hypothetical protein
MVGTLLAVPTANAAYRRSVLLDVGLFNDALHTGGDMDLAWRIQLGGAGRIVEAPTAVVQHQYGNTWGELYRRYARYGYSEVLLGTLYRDLAMYPGGPKSQPRQMARQVGALCTYVGSFGWRLLQAPWRGWDGRRNRRLILWFVAEGANLVGKCQALWATRWYRRAPVRTMEVK